MSAGRSVVAATGKRCRSHQVNTAEQDIRDVVMNQFFPLLSARRSDSSLSIRSENAERPRATSTPVMRAWMLAVMRTLAAVGALTLIVGGESAAASAPAATHPLTSASLLTAQPADGARDVALDTPIEIKLTTALTADQNKRVSAAVIGPRGVIRADVSVSGATVHVKPAQSLLPGSVYTVLVSLNPATHASNKADKQVGRHARPQTLAIVGWRTVALTAERRVATVNSSASAAMPDPHADETFRPQASQRRGDWYTHNRYPYSREMVSVAREQQAVLDRIPAPARERLRAHMQDLGEYIPPEVLATAQNPNSQPATLGTSLSGQILRLNGQPLADVTLRIGERHVKSNARGDFTIDGLQAGERVLVVDAQRAHRSDAKPGVWDIDAATLAKQIEADEVDFGRYEYRVNLRPGHNELPNTVWLTRIDHEHAVPIASPTREETIITHPDIPGLEVHLPAGTVIRDADGHIVREVSITPIPLDQMPVPMPFQDVGVYYTLQPGGAHIESVDGKPIAATLRYPNYSSQFAGSRRQLFDYDPQGRGWYIYGQGQVSADGKHIDSAEPFKIYQFALTSAASSGGNAGDKGPGCSGSGSSTGGGGGNGQGDADGDPVVCSSGLFFDGSTDLVVPDVVPIRVSRQYRPGGDGSQHAFGIGSNGFYDQYLYFPVPVATTADHIQLVQSNGVAVDFQPVDWNNINYYSGGAVYVANEPGEFLNAHLTLSDSHGDFIVSKRDGSRMGFSYYYSRLKWLEDRYGNRTFVMRDAANHVSRVVSPNGRWVDFTYADAKCPNCITKATDHTGRSVSYTYDQTNAGQLLNVTAPENVQTNYIWDNTAHQILTVKDARGNNRVTNTYYSGTGNPALDGRVKTQTYADGTSKAFSYEFDANGNITASEVKDQRGVIHRREYDGSRYLIKDILGKGTANQAITQYQRDPTTHQVLLETDPLGRQTQYLYDSAGNEVQRTVMFGTGQAAIWTTTYEPNYNQPLVSTDPLNRKTTRLYDANSNLSEVDDDLGHKTTYTWYPNGQLQSVSQWPGTPSASTQLTTTLSYEYGDLVQITDPKNRTTQFNVDALGRVIGVRDAAGKLSTVTYDGEGRITQRCDASGACANMVFDGNGNLTQFKLGTTQRDFSYDTLNRLQTEGRNSGQTPATEVTVAYTNTDGKQTITEASGRVTETSFDELWRRSTVKISQGGTLKRTLTYTWDAASRLKSVADSVAGSLSYTYDDRYDAIRTETSPAGTMTYGYYANGLRQSATPSGGTAVTYGFDAANRLRTISQAAGTGMAQPASALNVGIDYDNANRRSRLTLANGITVDYGWDEASQLTSLTYKLANGTALGDLAYGYDSLGRRTSISGAFARFSVPTPANLPVGADGRTTSDNGATLQYDSNGRLTQDGQFKYIWNELGQLTEMRNLSDNALRGSFSYDAAGRRISKTIDGQTTQYLYDGANPIQLQDGSGNVKENLLAGGIDEWFARTTAGQTQHYLANALGSAIRLTDSSGVKLVDYTYDPYGGTSSDAASTNVFQYAGRENDGLGLYFNRARYYKPKWGKFISQDPIGLAGGDNIYAYVGGNPLSYTDPKGLQAMPFPVPIIPPAGSAGGYGPTSGTDLAQQFLDWWNKITQSDAGDQPSAIDDCIEQCYPILERPKRGWWDDSNTYDFHKCIANCKAKKSCQ